MTPIDFETAQAGGLLIAADCVELTPEHGAVQHEPGDGGQYQEDEERVGQAERVAAAKLVEGIAERAEIVDGMAAGDHQRQCPPDRHRGERRHEGRHAQLGDAQAVEEAEQRGNYKAPGAGKDGRPAGRHQRGRGYGADAPNTSNGQIDAASDHDHRLADNHDPDIGEVAGVVQEIVRSSGTRAPRSTAPPP